MKLTSFGAAGEVTGSQHLLEVGDRRILLDCGLFQGHRAECRLKNERFHCLPKKLDAVVLSHAHMDHCGNLPGLTKAGFRGPIFCTEATADVAEMMLEDSAHIQSEDARYLSGRLRPGHPSVEPLYDMDDVKKVVKHMDPCKYHEWYELAEDIRIRFSDAGHILGSAITEIEVMDGATSKRIVFTGDLGRRGLPLLRDPELVEGCDVLITESTYANKVHPSVGDTQAELERIIDDAYRLGGRVIIPAFSLGRTQNIVYFLNELANKKRLPGIPVYVDSPLSKRITGAYRRHVEDMDADVQQLLQTDNDPFGFPGLTYLQSPDESIALNGRDGPFVVIASSGMCENGRVVHHLKHALSNPNNTVVLMGFQAANTLGRRIAERSRFVRIFDRDVAVRCKVETLSGLSAHADAEDFRWWFKAMHGTSHIGQAFIVHGEPESALAQVELLDEFCDERPTMASFATVHHL